MNPYTQELIRRIEQRYNIDSAEMTMGDWICANTHLRGLPFTFDRYPFQKQICDDMHPNLDCIKPSQVGLALALDTPVATPTGWSTMGELEIGDEIFDETGTPTRINYVSPIFTDHDCYELEFDTGETIVADANHRWWVQRDGDDQILTTRTLFEKCHLGFSIPNTKPLRTTELRGDIWHRRTLLHLIMQDHERGCYKSSSSKALEMVQELLHSLGYKTRTRTGAVLFDTSDTERRIVHVSKVETQPVRCIAVEAESHLFLAGKGMIPTHNTEVQIRKSLGFVARNRGTTLIFTFPIEKMFKKQSTTRIKPLVDEEKAFNLETPSGEKPTRSMGLYQIGTSFMHVTGATEGDATSISADVVMNDEVDLTDQEMLVLFNSRLQNSDWKVNQRFSTPTFSNYGIDKGFRVSDQHVYLCRCPACNHYNDPVFNQNFVHIPGLSSDIGDFKEIDENLIDEGKIDILNSYVKCEKCHTPLPLGDTTYREWVPKYPSRSHHRGYRVSPFSTDRLPPEYILTQMLKYRSRDFLRGWHNTVLGEAFTDGNSRLSDADIEACFTPSMEVPKVDPIKPTWIGIDMGLTCHVVVGQGEDKFNMDIVRFADVPIKELNDFIEDMLATYNVIGGACDRHPYTPNADDIFELSDGKIIPVEYRGSQEVKLVKDPIDPDKVTHAQANRTKAIDTVAGAVRRKRTRFSGYGTQKSVIKDHLKDMVRDENPEKEATWIKLTGNDHYFHGMVFLYLGLKLKETERSLSTNPRTVVSVLGVPVDSNQQSNLL